MVSDQLRVVLQGGHGEIGADALYSALGSTMDLDQPYIIAVTAHAMAEDRERCLSAGMNDYLSKPLLKERLRDALERAGS